MDGEQPASFVGHRTARGQHRSVTGAKVVPSLFRERAEEHRAMDPRERPELGQHIVQVLHRGELDHWNTGDRSAARSFDRDAQQLPLDGYFVVSRHGPQA